MCPLNIIISGFDSNVPPQILSFKDFTQICPLHITLDVQKVSEKFTWKVFNAHVYTTQFIVDLRTFCRKFSFVGIPRFLGRHFWPKFGGGRHENILKDRAHGRPKIAQNGKKPVRLLWSGEMAGSAWFLGGTSLKTSHPTYLNQF